MLRVGEAEGGDRDRRLVRRVRAKNERLKTKMKYDENKNKFKSESKLNSYYSSFLT